MREHAKSGKKNWATIFKEERGSSRPVENRKHVLIQKRLLRHERERERERESQRENEEEMFRRGVNG